MDAAREDARFLLHRGRELYVVTHPADGRRRGAVLLCGPLGAERERAQRTLVLWARLLAAQGFEVLRFDYSGNGESTGLFEDMSLADWRADVDFCANRLAAAALGSPVFLHGIRFGALPAAELFATGVGTGLLLWAAPPSAESMLRETLRRHLMIAIVEYPDRIPESRERLITALEAGRVVNVDGYLLTPAIWSEARGRTLRLPAASESRPWYALKTQVGGGPTPQAPQSSNLATVHDDSFWNGTSTTLGLHEGGLFEASLQWLDAHAARGGGTV